MHLREGFAVPQTRMIPSQLSTNDAQRETGESLHIFEEPQATQRRTSPQRAQRYRQHDGGQRRGGAGLVGQEGHASGKSGGRRERLGGVDARAFKRLGHLDQQSQVALHKLPRRRPTVAAQDKACPAHLQNGDEDPARVRRRRRRVEARRLVDQPALGRAEGLDVQRRVE